MTQPEERLVGGLRCGEVLALLPDLLAGELGAEPRAQVDAHLRGCDACTRFGGRYAALVADLVRLARAEPAPSGVDERLRQRLRAAQG